MDQPAEFTSITECRRLVVIAAGEFINRGKAFRRWDRSHGVDSRLEVIAARQRENRPRHWRAKNGAMQLVNGDVGGRKGQFHYPIPAVGARTRPLYCAEVNAEK